MRFDIDLLADMTFTNPFFAGVIILAAVLAVKFFSLFTQEKVAAGRFVTIDGLRGYLALFVFIHHTAIWFSFAKTGTWIAPPSNLYNQLGQGSVSLFFMITSFLFVDKLIEKRAGLFDWRAFFIGRIFRLAPLYFAAMAVLLAIVLVLSDGELRDGVRHTGKSVLHWIAFTGLNAPDINGVRANLITAGVTWSLPYEWCFYLFLPFIWLLIGGRGAPVYLVFSIIAVAWFLYSGMRLQIVLNFAGGIIAALLARNERCKQFATSRAASAIGLGLIASLFIFSTAFEFLPFLVLTLIFSLIACGTSLFGALTAKSAHSLGDLAYSIYLLHGILLFIVFNFIVGANRVASMSSANYLVLIVLLVPVLLAMSMLSFKYIELPGIRLGKQWGIRKEFRPCRSASDSV